MTASGYRRAMRECAQRVLIQKETYAARPLEKKKTHLYFSRLDSLQLRWITSNLLYYFIFIFREHVSFVKATRGLLQNEADQCRDSDERATRRFYSTHALSTATRSGACERARVSN